jgi:hypothetical protein
MSESWATFEIQSNQAGATQGLNPQSVITGEANRVDVDGGGSFWTTAQLPQPFIPPSGYRESFGGTAPQYSYVKKVIGMMEIGAAPIASVPGGLHAGIAAYNSEPGEYFWIINGEAWSNGGFAPIIKVSQPFPNGPWGRQAPPSYLQFGSAAGATIGALSGIKEAVHVHVEYGYPLQNPYTKSFSSHPPTTRTRFRTGSTN